MGMINLIIRIVLALAVFIFGVLVWAWAPYINADVDMNITILSVFFGNGQPAGWVRDLLLLSRGLLSMALVLYLIIPTLSFMLGPNVNVYGRDAGIMATGLSIVAFFSALVIHQLYYI